MFNVPSQVKQIFSKMYGTIICLQYKIIKRTAMKKIFAFAVSSLLLLLACDDKNSKYEELKESDNNIRASSVNEKNAADSIDAINAYGNDKDGRNSITRDENGTIQSNSDSDTMH